MTSPEHPRAYGSKILDHFQHPRNLGVALNFNHRYLEKDNPWRVQILLTLRVDSDVIEDVKFKAKSCVTATACLSALTEMVLNQSVDEALSITPDALSKNLEIVPAEKMYCCRLAVATLHRALSSVASENPTGEGLRKP